MTSPLFVLTSDLGVGAPAVAQLKAVIINDIPDARIIDLSHGIPPMSLRDTELALRATALMYPEGSVHVVVVDPDVGTKRRALAVSAWGRIFVAPDNGVLGLAFKDPDAKVVSLDRPELWRQPLSSTFHGRDVFVPVAVKLATGTPFEEVGTLITDPKPSGIPDPEIREDGAVVGETLGADRFGNLYTNIPVEIVDTTLGEGWLYEVDGQIIPYRSTYMAAKIGRTIVTTGADRFIEVAVTQGSAAEQFGRTEGIEVLCGRKV